MSNLMWHRIALTALLTVVPSALAANAAAPVVKQMEDDWLPEAAQVAATPASVPVVPLPPAVYGSLASLGLIYGLRHSRYRRWLTLRS